MRFGSGVSGVDPEETCRTSSSMPRRDESAATEVALGAERAWLDESFDKNALKDVACIYIHTKF